MTEKQVAVLGGLIAVIIAASLAGNLMENAKKCVPANYNIAIEQGVLASNVCKLVVTPVDPPNGWPQVKGEEK